MSHILSLNRGAKSIRSGLSPLAATLVLVPIGAICSVPTYAAETLQEKVNEGPQSGTLLMRAKTAEANKTAAIAAIRLGTDMDVTVSGSIARVRVTQVFRNTSADWMEATYLYPLPEDAAVDSLKMVVGQRVIIGRIKKREEAREIYETAKEEGRKAGLVEQQRPNMFSNSVANVGPGETVMIVIEYQMPLRQLDGTFSLRLPLVVAPRYVPPHSITSAQTAQDAATITAAPIVDPKSNDPVNPVSITVNLNPGFVPANVDSAYHKIRMTGKNDKRIINLSKGDVPSDRDFMLSWRSASADPTVALYKEQVDGKAYIMASITPPVEDAKTVVLPRELIFVIDNSGSMSGSSMDEAKSSLIHALTTLRPQDHFNIIRFDDTMTQLFDQSVLASAEQIATAKSFAEGLEASGGTEMLPALKAALNDTGVTDRSQVLRQVIFLTDGSISNEKEMLELIGTDNGRSRVFMVGIGSAPNNYLMSRMATMGRGVYTNIGSAEEVTAKMTRLLDMLSRPSVQGLTVQITGNTFDLTPRMLPDLYAGEPLVLLGQADKMEGAVTVSGQIGTRSWSQKVDLSKAIISNSVAKLWARRRIDDIEADRSLGLIEDKAANIAITDLGLTFSIVTSQTSLVAIDETPSRPAGELLREEELPINLPAGWNFDKLFGGKTAEAAVANETALAAAKADGKELFPLPKTAANYLTYILYGLCALLVGLAGLLTTSRKKIIAAKILQT